MATRVKSHSCTATTPGSLDCRRSRVTIATWSPRCSEQDRIWAPCGSSIPRPDLTVPAAGAPWFMTLFGRDSLLTAWMALPADPSLASGVLQSLARLQGRDIVPSTEEQPGRIMHETRFGAATGLLLGGGDVYYGSVDSTPLFVMVLGELRRWGLHDEMVRQLLPHADRAVEWIETFGDRDGDGYVEYQRATPAGLANQGWKDSWDAIRFADGRLAEPPIALCEVQAYTYAAYVARSHFALEAGDIEVFEKYRGKADELRRRFNEDFWLEEQETFALGLDRTNGRSTRWLPTRAIVSGPVSPSQRRPSWCPVGFGAGHVLGVGGAHVGIDYGHVQSRQLSQRLGLAARQRPLRRGVRSVRAHRCRPPRHRSPAGRRRDLRGTASRAVRRVRPLGDLRAGRVPGVVLATGLGGGVTAALAADAPRSRAVGAGRPDSARPFAARFRPSSAGRGNRDRRRSTVRSHRRRFAHYERRGSARRTPRPPRTADAHHAALIPSVLVPRTRS